LENAEDEGQPVDSKVPVAEDAKVYSMHNITG